MPSFPKPRPHIFEKIEDRLDADRRKRIVYAEVDARDQRRCRCCGRRGSPYATEAIGRIHRAHIQDRSLMGEMSARNLVSLCWICHALEHTGTQLVIVGTDANDPKLGFEIHEAAVVEVFGTTPLPRHVHIIAAPRSASVTP